MASTVAACLASIVGAWKLVAATSGPISTRSVTAAIAASVVHASYGPRVLPSFRSYSRWSPTQTESKPLASASRARSRYSGQGTYRSTSGSWTPILQGRVMGGTLVAARRVRSVRCQPVAPNCSTLIAVGSTPHSSRRGVANSTNREEPQTNATSTPASNGLTSSAVGGPAGRWSVP